MTTNWKEELNKFGDDTYWDWTGESEKIIEFIEQTLLDQKKEIINKISKLKEETWYKDGPDCDRQTIDEVLELIK